MRRTSAKVRRGEGGERETRESPPNRGTLDQRLHPEGYHIFRETNDRFYPPSFSYSYFSVSLFSLGKLGRFLPSIFLRRGCWSSLMLGLITRGWYTDVDYFAPGRIRMAEDGISRVEKRRAIIHSEMVVVENCLIRAWNIVLDFSLNENTDRFNFIYIHSSFFSI